MKKRSYPLARVYGLLEPGPVLLVATARKGRANLMTLSWHTMMEFEPPLVGCLLSGRIADTRWVKRYNFFVLEVVAAWVDTRVKQPQTLHHRGNGVFAVAGETVRVRSAMK